MWYFRYFPTSGKDGARLGSAIAGILRKGRSCSSLVGCHAERMRCDVPALLRHKGLKCCGVHPIAMNLGCIVCIQNIYVSIYILYIYIINYIYTHTVFMLTHLECRQFMNSSMMQLIWRAQMLDPTLPRNITQALNCKFPWDVNLSGCWEANP